MKQTQGERNQIIAQLVVKDLQGTLNRGEKEVLENWIAESLENKDLYERFSSKEGYVGELKTFHQVIQVISGAGKKKIEKELNFKIPDIKKGHSFTILKGYIATAAALLIVIGACIFLQNSSGKVKKAGKVKTDSAEDSKRYFIRAVKYSNNHFVAVLSMNSDTIFFQSYELNTEPTDLTQYKKAVLDTIASDIVDRVYKNYNTDSTYTIAADKVFTIEAMFTKDVFNQKVAKREYYHTNDFK